MILISRQFDDSGENACRHVKRRVKYIIIDLVRFFDRHNQQLHVYYMIYEEQIIRVISGCCFGMHGGAEGIDSRMEKIKIYAFNRREGGA